MNINWDAINRILGSKSFENVSALAGAGLQAYGQAGRNDRQLSQGDARLGQDATRLALEHAQGNKDLEIKRALAVLQGTKLGENENFATRNRVLSAVLPNLRNANMRPGDARVAAAMGPQSAGPLPTGGLPPEVFAALSDDATASAIAGRARQITSLDPRSAGPDFAAMGLDPDGTHAKGLDTHRTQIIAEDDAAKLKMEKLLEQALLSNYTGAPTPQEEKKQGFLGKLGGILKIAAPIAAGFIPGVGPLAAAAIGAGSAAAGTKMQGGSMRQSLIDAALGAASGAASGKLTPSKPGLPSRFLDPRFRPVRG